MLQGIGTILTGEEVWQIIRSEPTIQKQLFQLNKDMNKYVFDKREIVDIDTSFLKEAVNISPHFTWLTAAVDSSSLVVLPYLGKYFVGLCKRVGEPDFELSSKYLQIVGTHSHSYETISFS